MENKIHPHEKFKVRSWTQKFTSIKTKEKCIIWKELKFKSGIYENKGSKRSFGVGVHHVNNVIKSVGNLCGKTIDHFASVRTINRIGDQRLSISYKQMAELKDEESTTHQHHQSMMAILMLYQVRFIIW